MSPRTAFKPIEILLVEDNPDDIRLTIEAFNGWKLKNNISTVKDGVDAMAYLHREPPYTEAVLPDLILLDLNMPRMDGREVLAEIKQDDGLKAIPVVVLTTSQAEEDVLESYNLYANCYITKPIDLDQFTKVVQAIDHFWLSISTSRISSESSYFRSRGGSTFAITSWQCGQPSIQNSTARTGEADASSDRACS
ncbi:MAG: response regulator [Anaerolineales bacterium]|nr:response regulator [Anaerolineales bacterium]